MISDSAVCTSFLKDEQNLWVACPWWRLLSCCPPHECCLGPLRNQQNSISFHQSGGLFGRGHQILGSNFPSSAAGNLHSISVVGPCKDQQPHLLHILSWSPVCHTWWQIFQRHWLTGKWQDLKDLCRHTSCNTDWCKWYQSKIPIKER